MIKKHILRASAFLLLFALIYQPVSRVFSRPSNNYSYQMVAGFYEEPENSLDAVYVGSSNCFAFWNSMTAWKDYGITVYPLSCDDMPFAATPYMIEEARKTQPDALYIVNLNTLHDTRVDTKFCHYLLSGMPLSANKLALIRALADAADCDSTERLALYFPIMQFHDRWSQLIPQDFSFHLDGKKGSLDQYFYTSLVADISQNYQYPTEPALPDDQQLQLLDSLLDYADREQVKLLFVLVPRAELSQDNVNQFLYMEDRIQQRGYPIVNMLADPQALNLDLTQDFYNMHHSNIHGSVKFTAGLSEYLVANYDFSDKRGQESFSDWDQALEAYMYVLNSNLLDIEISGAFRTVELAAPALLSAASEEGGVRLTWDAVSGADGYCVYSKDGSGSWQRIAEVSETGYSDSVPLEHKRSYRVVPYRLADGQTQYGHFSYAGISVQP